MLSFFLYFRFSLLTVTLTFLFLELDSTHYLDPGHIRNIHFPFDIDVDTATDVASEMVVELDLTDQDVSAIAEMIDIEIRSYIPDWAPRELSGDHVGSEVAMTESCVSEGRGDSSPTTNESARSISLVLERMPSGRKYWSDSPRAGEGISPGRPGPSNLSYEGSATPVGSWTEDDEQSPGSCQQGDNLNDDVSLERQVDGNLNDTEDNLLDHEEFDPSDELSVNGPHSLGGNSNIVGDIDLDDDEDGLVKKLELLLAEQQRELDELKKKHELIVSDLLKEVPPETRNKLVRTCHVEISDHID